MFEASGYEERLKECGLGRGNQIEVFMILNGYENIYRNSFSQSRKIVELEDMN